MSLKGRGQGVDLGTSTLSLMRCIIFSFLGLEFPYDPLNLFPFLVFLSPLPNRTGNCIPAIDITGTEADGDGEDGNGDNVEIADRSAISNLFATASHTFVAIFHTLWRTRVFPQKLNICLMVVLSLSKLILTERHNCPRLIFLFTYYQYRYHNIMYTFNADNKVDCRFKKKKTNVVLENK